MKAEFILDRGSIIGRKKRFEKAQEYVDVQCIKKMSPYVPVGLPKYRNSGKLLDSASVEEPGRIVYTAPFARNDYYAHKNHRRGGNPNASRLWFEVMKHKDAAVIHRGAAKIVGGRAK